VGVGVRERVGNGSMQSEGLAQVSVRQGGQVLHVLHPQRLVAAEPPTQLPADLRRERPIGGSARRAVGEVNDEERDGDDREHEGVEWLFHVLMMASNRPPRARSLNRLKSTSSS